MKFLNKMMKANNLTKKILNWKKETIFFSISKNSNNVESIDSQLEKQNSMK